MHTRTHLWFFTSHTTLIYTLRCRLINFYRHSARTSTHYPSLIILCSLFIPHFLLLTFALSLPIPYSYFSLLTEDSSLLISGSTNTAQFSLFTAHSSLHITYFPLLSSHSLLYVTAQLSLIINYSMLFTSRFSLLHCLFLTVYFSHFTADFLLLTLHRSLFTASRSLLSGFV